jgi:broad specificity phosphatase PhoE
MEVYLIRHGHVDDGPCIDPTAQRLSTEGLAQAERVAGLCAEWGIQLLCASTMRRTQEMADAIHARLPDALRWDLQELEDLNPDDLVGEPPPSALVSTWAEKQVRSARERAWVRVMASWARMEVYARARGLERVAIVAHTSTLGLLLLNWLGLDWRAMERLSLAFDGGATCRVTLSAGDQVHIDWINRV